MNHHIWFIGEDEERLDDIMKTTETGPPPFPFQRPGLLKEGGRETDSCGEEGEVRSRGGKKGANPESLVVGCDGT